MAKTKKKDDEVESPELGGFLSSEEITETNEETDKRGDMKPNAPAGVYPSAKIVDIKITKSKGSNQPQIIIEVEVEPKWKHIPVYCTFGPGAEKIAKNRRKFVSFFYSAFEHVFEIINTKVLAEGITAIVEQVKHYIGQEFTEVVKHEQRFYGKMNSETGQVEIKESFDASHWFCAVKGKVVNFNEARSIQMLSDADAIAARDKIMKSSFKAEGEKVAADDVPDYMKDTEQPPI
jgi:hypothetical protein